MNNDVLLVPITVEQPNIEAQSDIVVYVPQAHEDKAGIVRKGDGVNIRNGEISLDRNVVEEMIDANKWVSYGFQQNLTEDEKGMARHNIGAGDNDFTGSYYDVTQKPHLNTDNTNSLLSGDEEINNTINLHKVSKTGSFNDLNGVPTETIDFAESERQKTLNLIAYPYYKRELELNGFKFIELEDGAIQINGQATTTNWTEYRITPDFKLPAGKYTLQLFSSTTNADCLCTIHYPSVNAGASVNGVRHFTLTEETTCYIGIQILPNSTFVYNDVVVKPMLVSGEATDYQPYNGAITHKGDAPVVFAESERQKSKNLFDENLYLSYHCTYANGVWTTSSSGNYNLSIFTNQGGYTSNRDISKLPYLKKGIYTITFYNATDNTSSSADTFTLANYNSNGIFISHLGQLDIENGVSDSKTFTLEEDSYLDIRRQHNSGTISFSHIQIEEGTLATSYHPYNGAIVHEKELNETVDKRELKYKNSGAISIQNSELDTLEEYFDLFETSPDTIYKCGIGFLENSNFKNLVGTPEISSNYVHCYIKKVVDGQSYRFNCYELFAMADYGTKIAKGYIYANSNDDTVVFSGWTIIGG